MTNDNTIDATGASPLEESSPPHTASGAGTPDPAMSITIALANELQQVYANDQQKLEQMNRSLRTAYKGTTTPDSHK